MSVTFSVVGAPDWCSNCSYFCERDWCTDCWGLILNVANVNARDLLETLGLDDEYLCGETSARNLSKLCHAKPSTNHGDQSNNGE